MVRRIAVRACVALVAMLGGAAHAQVRLHGAVGVTSDYVQAGLSQTRGEPALQGGVRADLGTRWAVGVWGSQIDRNPGEGATYEIDVYIGRSWLLAPDWSATLTATHYFFPNDTAYLRYDYDEIAATLGYRSQVFATLVWSPNTADAGERFFAEHEQTWALELTFRQPLWGAWSCDAGIGRRDMTALFGKKYWYGHAGISYAARAVSVHLTYTRADDTAHRFYGAERAADTLVGAIIWKIGGAD